MAADALPFPSDAELFAALGYPYLPVRVRHRAPLSWHPVRDGDPIAHYVYTEADGTPSFEEIRIHLPPDHPQAPGKAFLWRHVDADGRWVWGLDGVRTLLYQLPRVRAAVAAGERVFVVEGEKDVHALEALGLTATTSPMGALQWTERHAEPLRGADVVVIPDQDRAGLVHAARVIASLRGIARSVALLLLPVEPREDVSDWLARGNDAAELERLAATAPRDPSPAELAALLNLPPGADPLATSTAELRALLVGARPDAPAGPAPHPGFRRSTAAFARLGIPLHPGPHTDPATPEAHSTWRAITAAVRDADTRAALLDDASLLDRASYELGLFSRLVRAAMAEEPVADETEAAVETAPSVRLVHTRWDWDAFVADAELPEPAQCDSTWVLRLPPSGPVQIQRLHTVPAILLEVCARPVTRREAADAVAERVDADRSALDALVHAQIAELLASGLLRPSAATTAEGTVGEMRRLLLADEEPPSGARSIVGMLTRAVGAAREYADDARVAGDDPYPPYLLDVAVDIVQQLLGAARVRPLFAAELDVYWRAADAHERVRVITPLLSLLARALGGGRMPPYLIHA